MNVPILKRRISNRALAWLSVAMLLLSLTPLYILSFYNHAYYDDFGYTISTHAVWKSTGSFLETLAAAVRNTIATRQTWEGNYSSTFANSIQPFLFDEGLYWTTAVGLISFFLFSLWYFMRQMLTRALGADRSTFWMAYCCVAFVLIQFVPSLSEAFYWYSGGVAYTFLWSVTLLRLGVWRSFDCAGRWGRRIALYILLLLLTVIAGGAKFPTALLTILIDILLVVRAFVKKRPVRWLQLTLTLLLLACFAYCVTSPGNAIRGETLNSSVSAPKAVLQAFYFGLSLMGSWFSLPLVAVLAIVGWQLAEALRGSPYRFNHPVWVTLLCVCLFCAQLAPTLFTGNYIGDGRARDSYFYTFVIMSCALALYWEGWYIRRWEGAPNMPAIGSGAKGGLRLGAMLVAIALLVVGSVSYHPEGAESYGPQYMAAGSALRSLINGEAARYDAAMDERDADMNDDSKPDVILTPVTDVPRAFMGDALNSDSLDYVLYLYADYYNKQSVTLREEEGDAVK